MNTTIAANETSEFQKLHGQFGDAILKADWNRGDLYICAKREHIAEILDFLKNDPELRYTYFSECVGIDYSTWPHQRDLEERFEVVYNLMSPPRAARVFIKIAADDGQKIPTCKHVFLGADYPEREIWDMFGIEFEGNEQTERFLMPDDWVGHPLRKEYPLGGEDVVFEGDTLGPAVEDISMPHAGESFEGKTGTKDVSGR